MAFMISFKSVNGEPLMTKQLGTADEVEIQATLRLAVYDIVRLDTRPYRIVSIGHSFANSGVFEQPEPIMYFEFTVEPIGESA